MSTTNVKLYSLGYGQTKTYLAAGLFIAGNLLLPRLFHLIPQGGLTWLPIYFFTLIGAYKYGWKVGLLTAILSPLANSALFGMPSLALLPGILIKSGLLAAGAALAARRFDRVSILLLIGVVLFYQLPGILAEWIIERDFFIAVQDFRIGIPGMLMQVFGGYLFIRYILRK